MKRNDTWPPLKGVATGASLPDLTVASLITVFLQGQNAATPVLIQGQATPISETDESGNTLNWQYVFASGDTMVADTYSGELEILWPDGRQTLPNAVAENFTLIISPDEGDA